MARTVGHVVAALAEVGGRAVHRVTGSLERNGGNPGQVQSRNNYYVRFCLILGVDPGGNHGC